MHANQYRLWIERSDGVLGVTVVDGANASRQRTFVGCRIKSLLGKASAQIEQWEKEKHEKTEAPQV